MVDSGLCCQNNSNAVYEETLDAIHKQDWIISLSFKGF